MRIVLDAKNAAVLRQALGEYSARMEKLSCNEAAHTSIKDDLRGCDTRLAAIKEQEEKARAELAALREGDSESNSGLSELFKERDMLRCALSCYVLGKTISHGHGLALEVLLCWPLCGAGRAAQGR